MHRYFDNGWGVSVIGHGYGSDHGRLELAVLDSRDRIHYHNPVAKGDVQGWLTQEQVDAMCEEIAAFDPDPAVVEAAYLADNPSRYGDECEGHPAGPNDPMGQTVYCDGSCQA